MSVESKSVQNLFSMYKNGELLATPAFGTKRTFQHQDISYEPVIRQFQ